MTDGSAGARETVDLENLYKPLHTYIYTCIYIYIYKQIMTDGSAGARETVDLENLYKPTSEAVSALTRPSVTLPLPGVGEPARERERERERQGDREGGRQGGREGERARASVS
jgi:hypothetical protein